MSRTAVDVRDLRPEDGPALERLWSDFWRPSETDGADLAETVLATLAQEPGSRVVLAEADGQVVGTAYLRPGRLSPLAGEQTLQISHLQVAEHHTRRGVGRALMEAALVHAEQEGMGNVIVAGGANDRELNRFLARLGLSPVAVVRGAAVATLRARLPLEMSVAARSSRAKQVGQVVAARRLQRRARVRDATS